MSRIIAAYDLDEDHGRMWVNANLKRMPEVVIVANQRIDLAQTVTYVPESQAENDKLRKLCADLYEFAMDEYPEGTELNFAASMREFGIEVSDD